MSEARIEAVILKQQDYRENDALITVLSREHGKLGFVCRGIRKMASKNAVSCMPFVLSKLMFEYKEQATLFFTKNRAGVGVTSVYSRRFGENDNCPGDV